MCLSIPASPSLAYFSVLLGIPFDYFTNDVVDNYHRSLSDGGGKQAPSLSQWNGVPSFSTWRKAIIILVFVVASEWYGFYAVAPTHIRTNLMNASRRSIEFDFHSFSRILPIMNE